MAIGSTTSALGAGLTQYYDKLLMSWEKPLLRMMQFAQKRPCPANSGTTVNFTGYRPLTKPTAALSDEEAHTVRTRFGARQISATVAEWGQTARMSKLLSMTKIDPGLEEQIAIVGDSAARTLDYQLCKLLARTGVWGVAVTGRATNHQTAVVVSSGGTTSGTTSVFHTTSATEFMTATSATTTWTGAIMTVVRDGATSNSAETVKYGWAGRLLTIVPNPTSGDLITVNTTAPCAAAPEAFAAGDVIRIVATSNLATSNVGSLVFAMAQRDLIMNKATPFDGGYYAAGIPAAILYSLKLDSTWVNAKSYSDVADLYKGEVGRWYGSRVYEMTEPYRETAAGVEAETTGAVYHSFFCGKNAFGHTDLEGGQQKLYVVNGVPDSNEPIPRNAYVSWYHVFAQKALTAPWCVDVVAAAEA